VLDWVPIPGGGFQMGSDQGDSDETPVHEVDVPGLEMLRREVTLDQYAECVGAGQCPEPGTAGDCYWYDPWYGDHPVNCVDWSQAAAFCEWVGARLPSEAEWEHAARSAGQQIVYPWGDEQASCSLAVMDDFFHSDGCDSGGPLEVCSRPEGNTEQGLCDMAGNVWEWVRDWYHPDYEGAPADGSAWEEPLGSARVARGGGFASHADALRAANRVEMGPAYQDEGLGFRCAREGGAP